MTLEAWMYQDPEKVAIRREEDAQRKQAACGRCIHTMEISVNGKTLHACEIRPTWGRRCDQFKMKKGTP